MYKIEIDEHRVDFDKDGKPIIDASSRRSTIFVKLFDYLA